MNCSSQKDITIHMKDPLDQCTKIVTSSESNFQAFFLYTIQTQRPEHHILDIPFSIYPKKYIITTSYSKAMFCLGQLLAII